MSQRLFYAILSTVSLLIGAILYLLYRENTHLSLFFNECFILKSMRQCAKEIENDFLKFYFPDFLWAFSLSFGLMFVFKPKFWGGLICCLTSFLYGMLWETLQALGYIRGTGDFWDVVMYLMASLIAALIFRMRRKENEKDY